MKIDVVTSWEAVAALEEEWDTLLERTACNRCFSSFAWFHAGAGAATPLVVTARRDGKLAGLLPLVIGEAEAHFVSRLADYNDVIGGEGAGALMQAALDVVPVLALHELREESPLLATGFHDEREPARPVIWTPLANGYDAWLAGRSRAFRKSLFRAERAAASRGLVIRELDALDGETFLTLHDARPGPSVFAGEEHRAFVRRAVPPLIAQRRMRAFGLLDGERVAAIDLCAAGAGTLCTWNTGFLPEYGNVSPGSLLLAFEIRTACAEDLAEFDLGRGDEPYKLSWASERRELRRVRVRR